MVRQPRTGQSRLQGEISPFFNKNITRPAVKLADSGASSEIPAAFMSAMTNDTTAGSLGGILVGKVVFAAP